MPRAPGSLLLGHGYTGAWPAVHADSGGRKRQTQHGPHSGQMADISGAEGLAKTCCASMGNTGDSHP